MNKKTKITTLALVLCLGIILSIFILPSCANKPKNVYVKVFDNVSPESFRLNNAVVVSEYKGGKTEEIQVTNDMVSEEDFKKLSTPGVHTITIYYADNKSIETQINLLPKSTTTSVLNKLIKGIQLAAPKNNLNGDIEFSLFYKFAGKPKKEYDAKIRFTLDIDGGNSAENYLELEVTEDSKILFGVYYKDNENSRPNLYLKVDGPFADVFQLTEGAFPSVSADAYLESAGIGKPENLKDLDGVLALVDFLLGDDQVSSKVNEKTINFITSLIFLTPSMAEDGSAISLELPIRKLVNILTPLAKSSQGIVDFANGFLADIDSPVDFEEALNLLEVSTSKIILRGLFSQDGALSSFALTDINGNENLENLLSIKADGKGEAGLSIKRLKIYSDSSSFELPTNKGIENWEVSNISFERWILNQYTKMSGEPRKQTKTEGIEEYIDVKYKDLHPTHNLLDVYRPESSAGQKLPVIINIHGGGWVAGSKEGVYRYCQYLALQGFAVVNINYHLLPDAQMPVPMQDVFSVFNFVLNETNANKYGFDTNNVFLTGDSAGGHYTLLATSILVDPDLQKAFNVSSTLKLKGIGVNSTGFSFTNVIKVPIPFAHFYVNQFFSEDLPYTAYRDDVRYTKMAKALNIENNKLELFPPTFISSADGDIFKTHSNRLHKHLNEKGVENIYDFRIQNDSSNPEGFGLGHDFNIANPYWTISKVVNDAMCNFFKSKVTS